MQEAFRIDSLCSVLSILEISHADVSSSHADFSLLILLICLENFHLCTRNCSSNLQIVLHLQKAQLMAVGCALWSSAFRHAISIFEVDVQGEEVLADDWIERSRAEDEQFALVQSQSCFYFIED